MSQQASSDTNTDTPWSLGAALGAALAASACCLLPLAFVSAGIGGAWMGTLTALEPYRWIFATFAVGALGYAGYREWQISRPGCECDTSLSPVARRSLLGAGALAVLALLVSPWLLDPSSTAEAQQTRIASPQQEDPAAPAPADEPETPASFQQVVLEVEGMTCISCSITVQKALEGIEGVSHAEVTYEPPQAVVRFDPEESSVERLTQATKQAGYPSQLKSPS